jgi:hypothetical protein
MGGTGLEPEALVTGRRLEIQPAREELAGRRACEVHHSLANTPDKQTESRGRKNGYPLRGNARGRGPRALFPVRLGG